MLIDSMKIPKIHSVKYFTTALVLSAMAPLIVLIMWLLYDRYRLIEQSIYHNATIYATNISRALDQDLVRIESALELLADSNELKRSEFIDFHKTAKRAVKFQNVQNYVLTDISGKQVLNTFLEFGDTLPTDGTPAELARVFSEKKNIVTNLFVGRVSREHVLSMGVPVEKNGKIIFSLNTGISPSRISKIFQDLPSEWTGAVIDGNGTIIARSKDLDKFLGKPAVKPLQEAIKNSRQGVLETTTKDNVVVFTSFSRSTMADWSVAVGAPKRILVLKTSIEVLMLTTGCLVIAFTSIFTSRKISNKIENAIYSLENPARALAEGRNVIIEESGIKEVNFVNNAILTAFDSLQSQTYFANHDSLTGLPNRSLFNEILEKNLVLARRKNERFALLSIDLDGFKLINDTEGHPAGDYVLKEVGSRIKSSIRESDTVARFGGDEFLVLLPNSDFDVGANIAYNLIETISQPYQHLTGKLSASIGISVFPDSGNSISEMINSSDKALYKAKSAGKGCVKRATDRF